MSGTERLFFDTNAAIALLNGDASLLALWQQGTWAGLSIISVLGFLAWPQLDESGREVFRRFIERLVVVDLRRDDEALLENIIELRRTRALKLPDAIVPASASTAGATLITRDARLQKVADDAGIRVWHS